jgi:hypothetical protein
MFKLEIETCMSEPPIIIDIESFKAFDRKKSEIHKMLNSYIFEINTKQIRDEIKENVFKILSMDIINIRREKLKILDEISGNKKIKKYYHNDMMIKYIIEI